MFKFLITIVVLAVIGAGLWYSGWLTKIIDKIPMMQKPVAEAPAPVATTTPEKKEAPAPINDLPTATNDASDAALAQDAAAIDLQLKGLTTDNASTSASLSDKAVTQEY